MKRLVYIVNVDWFFISHRLPLARAARDAGWDVHIFTTDTGRAHELEKEGFSVKRVSLGRALQNPLVEILCFLSILTGLIRLRPQVVHCVAFKAVLWGGIAARLCGVPRTILAVTGFGSTFLKKGRRGGVWKKIIFTLLRLVCAGRSVRLIVQNRDDRAEFISAQIARAEQIALIKGSGVNLEEFTCSPEPAPDNGLRCVLPARLLRDKGVLEFVEAARILKSQPATQTIHMILVGGIDPHNPSSIAETELNEWIQEGIIEWMGHRNDMETVFHECHIAVLPSYREGLPKALIEAGACGRPSVTTDVPGCREIIQDGVNGLLVLPRMRLRWRQRFKDCMRMRICGKGWAGNPGELLGRNTAWKQ